MGIICKYFIFEWFSFACSRVQSITGCVETHTRQRFLRISRQTLSRRFHSDSECDVVMLSFYSELCNYNVMLILWFMGLWLWLQFSFDAFYCWISWTRGRCMRSFVMRFIVMHEWTICFIWHHHAQINFSECLLPRERCCTLVHWHAVLNIQYYECKRLTSVSLEPLVGLWIIMDYCLLFYTLTLTSALVSL